MLQELLKKIEEENKDEMFKFSDEIENLNKQLHELGKKVEVHLNEYSFSDQENSDDNEDSNGYVRMIDLLEGVVESQKIEIELLRLDNEFLNIKLNKFCYINYLINITSEFSDKKFNIQESIIEYLKKKIEKNKNGPRSKAERAKIKWDIAKNYFNDEIQKHETLEDARKAAAKKAGISAKSRRLIEMLPDPRRKASNSK